MGKDGNQIPVSKYFERNIEYLNKELRVEKTFDLIHHKIEHGGIKIGMFLLMGSLAETR
ncbi:hypothetical protein [Piscibacillus salipiscarius]|uniref:hypothetical protein n=1 Tax=Piscibacillus salipiscarius TaxID=299480 RepID=UPI0034E1A5C9